MGNRIYVRLSDHEKDFGIPHQEKEFTLPHHFSGLGEIGFYLTLQKTNIPSEPYRGGQCCLLYLINLNNQIV